MIIDVAPRGMVFYYGSMIDNNFLRRLFQRNVFSSFEKLKTGYNLCSELPVICSASYSLHSQVTYLFMHYMNFERQAKANQWYQIKALI